MSHRTEIIVTAHKDIPSRGVLTYMGQSFPCALGKQGVTADKKEGDMKTPEGSFPLRACYYRHDKLSGPIYCPLPLRAILPVDGWCDDPADGAYNRRITLPYGASAESLWRADGLYDVIIILGHNDQPVMKGRGSAIFLHVAREKQGGLKGTEGCIALNKPDLLEVLTLLSPGTILTVKKQ